MMTFKSSFSCWYITRIEFFLRDNKRIHKEQRTIYSRLLSFSDKGTFGSYNDADSGLFFLFNYPACSPFVSSHHRCRRHRFLSFARGKNRKSNVRSDNELSSRTRFLGRNRKYCWTIMTRYLARETSHSLRNYSSRWFLFFPFFHTPTSAGRKLIERIILILHLKKIRKTLKQIWSQG